MDRPLAQDFREFLALLDAERIEYLLVGGHAVSFHGFPRATGDLDIWIATTTENASRMAAALAKFGFASGVSPEMFLETDRIVRMGVPPVRIEVMGSISGVRFAECYARRIEATLDGVRAHIISKADLLVNKRAAGRDKDRADVAQLDPPTSSPESPAQSPRPSAR